MKGTLIDTIPPSPPLLPSIVNHIYTHPSKGERVKRPTDCLFGVSTNRLRPSRTWQDLSPKTGVVKTVH